MRGIYRLQNIIQEYAWGSRTVIADLLGEPTPSPRPQAELWMGAHPKAPSMVNINGRWSSLKDLIDDTPEAVLGKPVAERFDNRLPYLFKVLAAEKPLSIQAHPDRKQAREGFKRENASGIALNAPDRNYKDDMHKPEMICALTPFWALNGFRKIDDIIVNLKRCCPTGAAVEVNGLIRRPDAVGLKQFFESMVTASADRIRSILEEVTATACKNADPDPMTRWTASLHEAYPGDVGVLAPLYLNLVCLAPGEAMFLPAGQLHAYLQGSGIELMANSDNVLRGGLTSKHVDVPELLKTLRFEGKNTQVLHPVTQESGERVYPSQVPEFVLSVLSVTAEFSFTSREDRSTEILICIDGRATVSNLGCDEPLSVKKGESVVVLAAASRYSVEGRATLYKAAVNL